MDAIAVITAVGGLLSGGGVMALLNWRANRRKATAEASQAEASSTDTAVEALNKAIDTLQEEREHDRSVIDQLTKERETLTDEKISLINRLGALKVCMCVHLGCVIRKPTQGGADKWMTEHESEILYGADYTPIGTLMANFKNKVEDGGEDKH